MFFSFSTRQRQRCWQIAWAAPQDRDAVLNGEVTDLSALRDDLILGLELA
jgi:hypothetical protein